MGHMLLPTDLDRGLERHPSCPVEARTWRNRDGLGQRSNLGEVDIAIDLGFLTQSADDLPLRREIK